MQGAVRIYLDPICNSELARGGVIFISSISVYIDGYECIGLENRTTTIMGFNNQDTHGVN